MINLCILSIKFVILKKKTHFKQTYIIFLSKNYTQTYIQQLGYFLFFLLYFNYMDYF